MSMWFRAALAVALVVLHLPLARAAEDCASETASLQVLGRGVEIKIDAPGNLRADGALHVSWKAKSLAPIKLPVFISIAIPGEVRFHVMAAPSPAKPKPGDLVISNAARGILEGNSGDEPGPELPGFLALSPESRGPLGLEFGRGKTRALVPLHQSGAKLSGAFDVKGLAAGDVTIEAAVIARTSCGERVISTQFDRTFKLAPGAPEIVVQDPYDIDQPKQVIVSNNGHYRAHVFDGRYRIFDIKTGAKLLDRAGVDVNFSPTARFVVASVGSAGQLGRQSYETVDLATGDVMSGLNGAFIGFTEGDAYLIEGAGDWGSLSIRPTLITRPAMGQADTDTGGPTAGLLFKHPGSCHACQSWSDDSFALDLDNGIVAFAGKFEADNRPIYELASGAVILEPGRYYVLPALPLKGWAARVPIKFSHIYDVENVPIAKKYPQQNSDKDAKLLKAQWQKHKVLDPKVARTEVAALAGSTVVRGDWRSRIDRHGGRGRVQTTAGGTLDEMTSLGLNGPLPLESYQVPFVNSSLSMDRRTYWDGPKAEQKRIDTMITERSNEVAKRVIADVPAVASRIGSYQVDTAGQSLVSPLPYDDPEHGKIYLDETLEGMWRWQVKGRPVWFLQQWATEGNGGIGQGAITLLIGDVPGSAKTGAKIIDLTKPLETFWAGQYGATDHQTQIKAQVYLDRYLVLASVAASTIAVFDLDTNMPLGIIGDIPQADLLANVMLTADARNVIQVNSDGQFFNIEIASSRVAVSGRIVDDEIIAYTPEGYYWSSYEGAHFVQLRFPGLPGVFPFQQFAHVLDRPEVIQAQLKAGAKAAARPVLSPPPSLELAVVTPAKPGALNLRLTARASSPLAHARIFADGQLLSDLEMSGTEATQTVTVPAANGARWLTAQVSDSDGLVSAPQSIRLQSQSAPTRKLHAVLIGNDHYANPQYTLKYARHDAERLGAVLAANPGHAYASTEVKVLADQAASKAAILAELTRAVETVGPADTLLFSFAGHGIAADSGYYLTPSGFDEARISETALAWHQIAGLLHRAKGRVIVVLDACHAGLSGAQGLGTNDQAIRALLSGEHPPMLVLAASKGRQSSYEDKRWDGGVFTYALLEVLQGKRSDYDLDRDGAIEVSELYRGLRSILTRETGDRQSPWLVRQDLIGDFAVF